MLHHFAKKENKFLLVSLIVFVLSAFIFSYHLNQYSTAVQQHLAVENRITKVDRIYSSYLSSVFNKRGYQFELDKESLEQYLEFNLDTQQLMEEFENNPDNSVLKDLCAELVRSNAERRIVLNRHSSYLDSIPRELAIAKIKSENSQIISSSLVLEGVFDNLRSYLVDESHKLQGITERMNFNNSIGFAFLGFLAVLLIIGTYDQTRKNTLLEAERKNQDEILSITRNSELEFRTAFQHAAIGMALVSEEGRFKDVNPSLCKLLGYPKEELLKLTFMEITHPDDLFTDLKFAKQLFEKKIESYSMEKRYFTKEGQTVWIHLNGSAVWNQDGSLRHFIAQIENITDSKHAANELEERERKFKSIFNSTFQFIGFLDPDGTLLEVNETALDFSGTLAEDVVGKKFWDCYWWQISEETQEQLRHSVEKAAQGEFIHYEVAIWDKDKNPVTILFNLKPILDKEGKVTAIVPEGRLIQDIVDARKSLIEKNLELERFASVASHDLKEPLRMVINFLQLLERKYKGQLDEKADQYIHFAVDASLRMDKLISDLLEFSKAGTENVALESIDLMEVLQDQVGYFSSLLEECGGDLIFSDLPVITGKKVPVNLLFRNLIGNALKYKKHDTAPIIRIQGSEHEGHWEFTVADNGIGFEEEYREVIFEMFKRLHTRQEYSGTGLGLSICKKIVEHQQGNIWADSTPGEGSTFHFTWIK